jgi:hypothetical protein
MLFGIPNKLVRPITVSVNEICSKIRIRKHLFETFTIHNHLKQGDALSPLLFNFTLEYSIRKFRPNWGEWGGGGETEIESDTLVFGLC